MEASSSPLSSLVNSEFSSPLSDLSKTPSLPNSPAMPTDSDPSKRYPSPSSTTASGTQSPVKLGEPIFDHDVHDNISVATDGPPPAKRRRISPPKGKERTTEYLDLTKPEAEFTDADNRQMDRLVAALRKKKKIVVIAGAGISVSAGIPDFRSSTGLFATTRTQHKLKASGKHLFDASVYKHDATTQSFHTMVREMAQMTKQAEPTPFHHLLASLAQEGRLLRLYSQNIDCIDTSMKPLATNVPLNPKGPWPVTIQLHGGLEKMVCTKCARLEPFNGEVFDGPEAPLCPSCQVDDEVRTNHAGKRSHGIGRLRPRFVLYNEYNPDEDAIGKVSSADLKARPDAVIVVGTTLKVPGTRRLVKELCQVTRGRRNGLSVWINTDSEPKGVDFKDCWDIVVKSKCDNVARLAALPPWDCSIGDDYLVSQEQDRESRERRKSTTFAVALPASSATSDIDLNLSVKREQLVDARGIPTPSASPKIPAQKQSRKTKQSKLSFGGKQSAGKPAKATKPRARKLKPAAKEQVPKNTLAETFKAVKQNTATLSGRKPLPVSGRKPLPASGRKPLPGSARRPLPNCVGELSLVTTDTPVTLELRSIPHGDNFLHKRESSEHLDSGSSAPSTPTTSKGRETISPSSYPSGLRNLFD